MLTVGIFPEFCSLITYYLFREEDLTNARILVEQFPAEDPDTETNLACLDYKVLQIFLHKIMYSLIFQLLQCVNLQFFTIRSMRGVLRSPLSAKIQGPSADRKPYIGIEGGCLRGLNFIQGRQITHYFQQTNNHQLTDRSFFYLIEDRTKINYLIEQFYLIEFCQVIDRIFYLIAIRSNF